jgi:hypothetical protein
MKRFGKLFFGVLCMILLFACSHAPDVTPLTQKEPVWVETNSIKVSWDASTTQIPKNEGEIMYLLYVKEQNLGEWGEPVEKYVDGGRVDSKTPISVTSCEIKFEDKSRFEVGKKYLLGVSTVTYKDKKIINESDISCSGDEKCTTHNPFGVIFTKK